MVSEKFKLLVGKVKKRLSDIKPEDITNFAIKEAAGSIPIVGQYIKDAIDEFSPDEKLELLQELKGISQNQFTELGKEIGVSVEYLKDIKTFTYDACAIQKADHEEIKELLNRIINQTKFEIREQKAKIIYNVAGDIIFQHPITHEQVYIPSIQSVLRKDETTEGDFFKKEPEWVDYEQGFIVERKEVDEIIKKLDNNKVQLVLGAPASGKSIILKNVGFRLANENKKVFFVELKKHPQDEIKLFFENIPKIDDDNPIIIIDDAHLYLSVCERMIRNFKGRGKGNLIFGSRETREITEEHPKEGAEYELLSELSKTCIHIQAEDVTERMIRTFLEKQYQFNEDKIKIISDNLVKYKEDLWFLSWALKAYNSKKNSVDDDEIYEKIAYSIEKIKIGKEKETINAEDVFLPLSVFFRYEIPLERKYLEEELELDGKIINQLIGLQEIGEMKKNENKILSFNHSSIAELYFGAYLRLPDLGRRIKKNILNGKDEKYLEFCSFCRYLTTTGSRNAVDVVISLYNRDYLDENDGSTILKKLIEIDKIQKSIENGINKEEDIRKVGWCLSGIAKASKEVALSLANSIDINALSSNINKERDIGKVSWCLSGIAKASQEVALSLANSIDINLLSSKINKEDNIVKVRWCILDIAKASKEVALSLANSIDINALSSKINKEEDIVKVRLCVSCIALTSKELAKKLTNNIDIDILSSKINKEEDIGKVRSCVSAIARIRKKVAMNLANSININVLSSKINKEEYIDTVGWCLSDIAQANKEVALKLSESIDFNALSSKINNDEDIGHVGSCVSYIAKASKGMARKLSNSIDINALSSKINKEEDIRKVGWCLSGIGRVSKEVTLKLVDSIDISVLSTKINKEEDIGHVGSCLSGIARAKQEVALKLTNSIDINVLSSKINKEDDIGKVRSCLLAFAWVSKEVAMKLVDSISAKIDTEEDIGRVGLCLSGIAQASQEMALSLANSIDINVLSSKINKEEDIGKVRLCVSGITLASEEVAMKLVDIVSAKIDTEEDIGRVGSCLSGIAQASQEVAMKLVDSVSAKIDAEEDIGKVGSCVLDIARASKEVANEIITRLNPKLREELQKKMSDLKIQASAP